MNRRAAVLQRFAAITHGREGFIIDIDHLRRVFCDIAGRREHNGDRLSHICSFAIGEDRPVYLL